MISAQQAKLNNYKNTKIIDNWVILLRARYKYNND